MAITILLVDDHPLFRKRLRLLIEEEPDMSAVGEAGDGKEALEKVRELSPDVVGMDISMPDLNGIEATVIALLFVERFHDAKDLFHYKGTRHNPTNSGPSTVMTGIRLFFKAWRSTTICSRKPLARAVRI